MKLKELTIRALESWEGKGEGFKGKLTTISPTSEVSIMLSDVSCRKILEVAAGGLEEAAHEQATFLVQSAQQIARGNVEVLGND